MKVLAFKLNRMPKEQLILLQQILFFCEWIALIGGLIVWKRISKTKYRYFVLYLLFIVLGELSATYIGRNLNKGANILMYNYLIIPAEFIFFYWFFYVHLNRRWHKLLCIIFVFGSIFVRLIEFTVLKNEQFSFSSLSYLISTIFLVSLALIYLVQFIKSDQIIYYYRYLSFWVTIALLIYYLGSFPLFAFYNYLYAEEKSFFYSYWKIQIFLNMFMYLIFAFGFLWTNIKHRYSYCLQQ
jgi:hypothetical protein